MKTVRVEEAIGHVLCHDVTKIVRGGEKGPRFRKGHVIREEDIPELLSIGKEHVYVFELGPDELHENDGAEWLRKGLQRATMHATPVKEGKIELISDIDGLFLVDRDKLKAINSIEQIALASRRAGPVKAGQRLAGTRVIPLVINRRELMRFDDVLAGESPFRLKPFVSKKLGVITTGNELYHGRIQDTFTDVLLEKFQGYAMEKVGHITCADDVAMIQAAIDQLRGDGAELILCTGGMSVDPDDVTPSAVVASGATLIRYGAPVLPGSMFMVASFPDCLILGVPSCAMYHRFTIFDILLPYVMADEPITFDLIAQLGEGGFDLKESYAHYPRD